ncbi:MAG: zinc-binding dehydrogenase [Rhodospirillaceae bacterium]|jgi:NADPH:quinone reductase-like Zn-dependent oxidoreductase|nr:zinc-binding dehydrogenase [Rhodospirillaceae bacterium]MBT5244715.1 zinc-binding dehydrogenase [Rhodospirillaceae bacterium]MBT5562456.1 zinc-binding dehydrogenase [Rhodospirillaceae bacterium]MBT6242094.1 zinc-binding dehydrogenase [Rhodospirillaceae bacterium]MBT7136515.1 zinc-binding dehydrogenase [Rhodospirillaceae bacterium]
MQTKKMCGVLLNGHGGFEQLEYREDISIPVAGPGEVLVAVGAAAVNNTDINTRIGWYSKSVSVETAASDGTGDVEQDATWGGDPLTFPRIQGIDVCGRITAVGQGVVPARIGERVLIEPCLRDVDQDGAYTARFFGSECDGGFSQFTTAPAVHAHRIDSPLGDVELASFPCSYSTAENMLTRLSLKEGETVLITGASGGVGSAAVQLAKRRGARIIAVSGPAKAGEVRALGADMIIPRGDDLTKALGTDQVDAVVDIVAGPDWSQLLEIMKPGGRYAVSGAIAGPMVELDVRTLYLKDLSFFGCTILEPGVFANLIGYIERGEIKPVVAKTYLLRDIVTAQKDFLDKAHTGKLVLDVPPYN